eukprot:TRINITY_DN15151_c0_g1_i2.p1 TRINITY_DN15151_c0_g1~~TRINITY_DN15151_c0_g1_i2.p1  ORF type:complete len:418 (-),score=76.60 TRINITY_DN15151_c0_g1_i2:11-1264(-)
MMVKDEAHTLGATLLPIKPFIDVYYILDTGSTDGTQDVVRKALNGIPGKIFEEPFVDYGASRNRIMDLTYEQEPRPVFQLMLSADETAYNMDSLRTFCHNRRYSAGVFHEAYPVVMDSGWKFDSLRLSRVDSKWRYVGRVHEYLAAPPEGKGKVGERVPDTYIKFRVTDFERRAKREFTILKILKEEVAKDPGDTRSSFYLARTYSAVGNHSAAIAEFERRVSLGGWEEEVYESLYAIAWELKSIGRGWPEIQAAFLRAHEHSRRAEPLFFIAEHYHEQGEFSLAYIYALRASQLEYPQDAVLWVNEDVYKWKALRLLADCAIRLGKSNVSFEALQRALMQAPGEVEVVKMATQYEHEFGVALRLTPPTDGIQPEGIDLSHWRNYLVVFIIIAVVVAASSISKRRTDVKKDNLNKLV